jgi:type II secretory pathway component GspD/PulD (secretin)
VNEVSSQRYPQGMRRRRLALALAWAALVLFSGAGGRADDTVLKVIPLKNRPASDLLPALAPLVGPDGSVTALDTRLVVKATPQALARIEALLPSLDTPFRSLIISVSQGIATSASGQTAGAGGAVSTGGGGTTVVVSPPRTGGTTTVETRTNRTVVTGSLGAGSASSTDDVTQQIRTLEGHAALIRVGRSEPFTSVGVVGTPSGPVVSGGTTYAESGTGFHVLPRVAGDVVTLELWAENTKGEGPIVVGQDLRTTVSGPLGQWIEVGSALRQAEVRAREVLGASFRSVSEQRSVRVRVDEAR